MIPSPRNQARIFSLLQENQHGWVLYAKSWNPQHAEDLLQDALVRLLQETPFPENPKAWVYRVIRNRAVDLHRKREKQENYVQKKSQENWFESGTKTEISGEDATGALEKLEPGVREIIVARIWGTLSFREIAELTDRPISSVHLDYRRGIDLLRKILNEETP